MPGSRQMSVYPCPSAPISLSPMADEDELLIERVAAGDDSALVDILERYGGLLLGVAKRVSASRSAAEDALQEVLAELWRHPERFDRKRGSLRSYLGVQVHRRAVDALRSDVRRKAREQRSGSLEPPYPRSWSYDVDAAALCVLVRDAVGRLPSSQRQVVELAYWEGRTLKDVATKLGVPEGTAKSRLRLAQAKLTEWLAPMTVQAP